MVKTWKVEAEYFDFNPGFRDVYFIPAETLYDAFHSYYKNFGTKLLVEIKITEVSNDE